MDSLSPGGFMHEWFNMISRLWIILVFIQIRNTYVPAFQAGHVGSIPITRFLTTSDQTCQSLPKCVQLQDLRHFIQDFDYRQYPALLPANDHKCVQRYTLTARKCARK
jgi:hypothetical protein